MGQTSYEVQVMQEGRWRIHAQFPSEGREDAVEEAKTLESLPGISGIKVVRDVYDDRTGLHQPTTVHKHTPKKSARRPVNKYAKYQARANATRASDKDGALGRDGKGKNNSSGMGVIVKILLVLLFSIALSAVLTGLISAFLPTKIADFRLVGTMRANVIISSALILFVLSVAFSFNTFMGRDELKVPEFERQKRRKRKADIHKRAEESRKKTKQEKEAKQELERLKAEKKEQLKKQMEEDKEAENDTSEAPEEKQAEEKSGEIESAQEDEQEGDDGFSRLSPMAEQQKAVLMSFFGEAVRNLPPERKKMDNYNRFGLNLYLAGAAEAIGGERNLDGETTCLILTDALQTMGLKEEHAESFARRYEDYLLQDARYMEVFQAGRRSVSDFMGGNTEAPKDLNSALDDWNKPKAQEDPEKEVVVMFTDIVGSTAMTHEKGNVAAQEVVRAHNRVVRDALASTGGKEIKHTGDGIMASFENVTKSLVATQQMQMMIRIHNGQGPDLPLKVKIGINAGRVVMEEQDLYGVTVQLAARIVDKAKDGQILVSDTVYGMAQGGSWKFVKRGPFYMKGITGPAYLQELMWDDHADITQIEAEALAERPALEQTYATASGQTLPAQVPEPQQATADQQQTPQSTATVAPQSAQTTPVADDSPPQTMASPTPPSVPSNGQAQAVKAYATGQQATANPAQNAPPKTDP